MNMRKSVTAFFACAGILALILDGVTAIKGASAGIELCLKTVVPSLFPFLFLCALLTNALWGGQVPWMKYIGRKLGIPEGAESIFIAATLGGYPAGAQIVGTAHRSGSLSEPDACHLLTFCSNAGPAFLFGMTGAMFLDKKAVWAMWMIQILSAALTAVSGRHVPVQSAKLPAADRSISELLMQTVRVMAVICGWILLFRILTAFLEKWVLFLFDHEIQVLVTGFLELSNGCVCLNRIENNSLRFLICTGFLSFGGLCVTMQTLSVIGSLPFRSYLTGKLLQTVFAVILSLLYLHMGWRILPGSFVLLCLIPVPGKKGVDFRLRRVYNTSITTGRLSQCCSAKR